MKVSIVIPNFNGSHLLRTNLLSVITSVSTFEKKTNKRAEIIIVDDGSSDNSLSVLDKIKKNCDRQEIRFCYLSLKKNSGFSSAINIGVKSSKGEIVVLLNSDVRPKQNFLEFLLPHFENEKVFAVGCMDESIENNKIVDRGRGIGEWKKGLLYHSAGKMDQADTLWVNGGSGAFRRIIWEKIGGMQEVYNPYYWEDIDISYRAQKAGFETVFEKKSIVVHEHEAGIIKTTKSEKDINKVAYRNQFFFVWINVTDSLYLTTHFLWLPYHIFTAVVRGDIVLLQGFIMAVWNANKIISIRNKTIKLFVTSDKEILHRYKV